MKKIKGPHSISGKIAYTCNKSHT